MITTHHTVFNSFEIQLIIPLVLYTSNSIKQCISIVVKEEGRDRGSRIATTMNFRRLPNALKERFLIDKNMNVIIAMYFN